EQIDDSVVGNDDGIIQPGETIDLPITLRNTGNADASSVSATLSSSTPGVTILQNSSNFPTLTKTGGTGKSQTNYRIAFGGSMGCPSSVSFSLNINAGSKSWSRAFQLNLGNVALANDFESNAPGWFHVREKGKDKWSLSGKQSHSSSHS